jgi:hypothetical protein
MSSIDAAARFAEGRAAGARKRSGARNLDAVAAAIILERWLAAPDDADRVIAHAADADVTNTDVTTTDAAEAPGARQPISKSSTAS